MENCITTYSGININPFKPDINLININDIAHALSFICRGNGHISKFWSVGEHCIACCKEAILQGYSQRVILACLLHDASECYLSDVPRPCKVQFKEYQVVENHLLDLIFIKYLNTNLSDDEAFLVKKIDDEMLAYDLKYILNIDDVQLPNTKYVPNYDFRNFKDVENEYLSLFNQYKIKSNNK